MTMINQYLNLIIAAGVIAALIAVFTWGYSSGKRTAEVACSKQMEAIKAANDAAIAKADITIRDYARELNIEKKRLENAIEKIDQEAAADPDADNCGIGSDSVQRLNSVK